MKPNSIALLTLLLAGCASQHTVHERGWVGGSYARAIPARKIFVQTDTGPILHGLPEPVRDKQKTALLITDLDEQTPLHKSGCREGDLILALNHTPVTTIRDYLQTIGQTVPGSTLELTLFRDGVITNHNLTIGREQFKHIGMLAFGFKLSPKLEFDFWPNPDFSLVALGYDRESERLNLHQTETRYLQSLSANQPDHEPGRLSREGWRTWLGPLSVSKQKQVLSQELVNPSLALKTNF